jgi:hypothetical protein
MAVRDSSFWRFLVGRLVASAGTPLVYATSEEPPLSGVTSHAAALSSPSVRAPVCALLPVTFGVSIVVFEYVRAYVRNSVSTAIVAVSDRRTSRTPRAPQEDKPATRHHHDFASTVTPTIAETAE